MFIYRTRGSRGRPLKLDETAEPDANIYDIITEPSDDKPIESNGNGKPVLPPGNRNPYLELCREPNEKDYDYAYGHIVAGSGGVVDGTTGSGNQNVVYVEIDHTGVDVDTECVVTESVNPSDTVNPSDIVGDTADPSDTVGNTVVDAVNPAGTVNDTVNHVDTVNPGDMVGDTVGDTSEKPEDTVEDSDMTMVENDLYSTK